MVLGSEHSGRNPGVPEMAADEDVCTVVLFVLERIAGEIRIAVKFDLSQGSNRRLVESNASNLETEERCVPACIALLHDLHLVDS